MKDSKRYYAVLTREAQDSIRDPLAIVVYLTLQRHMNYATHETWVSDSTAAKEAGMSLNTFKRKRKILKELGWITWKYRHGTTNLYEVYLQPHIELGIDPTELTDSSDRANHLAPTELQRNYNIRNLQEVTINKELLRSNSTKLDQIQWSKLDALYWTRRFYHNEPEPGLNLTSKVIETLTEFAKEYTLETIDAAIEEEMNAIVLSLVD